MTGDLIVEVAHGPQRGQKAVVRPGQRLVVGGSKTPGDPVMGADRITWSLADETLAAQQFLLAWDGHGGTLQHLGDVSKKTCLEGQPSAHGPVRHGTWIRAGATDLTLARERHTPPEEPPTAATIAAAGPALVHLTTVADPLYAIVDASRSPRIRGASVASSARKSSAAAPRPTMPGTFSVPDRRPPSWCPPFCCS